MAKASLSPTLDAEIPVQRVVDVNSVGPPPAVTPVRKVYYSLVRELYIGISAGKLETLSNGTVERLGEKFVRFTPMGDRYGIFSTEDPEIIAALEKRMADARAYGGERDVISEKEYDERTLTPDVKLQLAQRELESRNRLLEDQIRQNEALKARLAEYQKGE